MVEQNYSNRIFSGGQAVYGASLGILMLEARFPRIHGDMGNAETWPFPVHYTIVTGATPDKIVRGNPSLMLQDFVVAGQELLRMGVSGITTNCGFLALLQQDLQQALPVPLLSSSLMQVPMVEAVLPKGKRVGIITISSATLSAAHLQAAGVALDTPIVGTDPEGEFTQKILGNALTLDVGQAERELITAAERMRDTHPEVAAIVLECTNMMPYARAMNAATGLPIYGMDSLVRWFHAGLVPFPYD